MQVLVPGLVMAHVDAVMEVIICFRHVEFLMAIGPAGGIKAFFIPQNLFSLPATLLYASSCFVVECFVLTFGEGAMYVAGD